MLGAGISAKQIEGRIRTGALLAVFRGVYRVGHTAPSIDAHYIAAVKACGAGALLSGTAAAHLLGLLKGPAPAPEVAAPRKLRVRGVKTRRGRRQGTIWRGIPVTTPAETLVDLAAAVDEAEPARACHEAGVRHHTTPRQVEAVLARRPNTPGATTSPSSSTATAYHHSGHAWERDRLREREAYARDDEFRRFTYGDVMERSAPMLAELSGLLRPTPSALPSPP